MEKGTVWIIGGSSGLGLATAKAFAADGWFVISGARSFKNESYSEFIHQLPLDITQPESRDAFIQGALALRPRVDALVYCAAILVLSPCESTAYEEYARVMQTNFLGMTAIVSRILPIMREQKSGKIVLFSSINGLLGIPFQSAYVASKHAVEGYAECLAMECKAFGIQVSVIEPGDHRGGSQRCRLSAVPAEDSPYHQTFTAGIRTIRQDEGNGLPPSGLADAVLKNTNRKHMHFRVRVAKADQKLAVILHDILPASMNMRILRDYYGKK